MFGIFFLLTQYFQLVLGYGTFEAGLRQLPFAAVMMLIAPNSPKFAARFGANVAVAFGLVGIAAGMFLFTIARVNTPVHRAGARRHGDGRRHGDVHSHDDRLDHVGGAARQGRRRLGDERHHPRARRRPRRRRARQPRRVALRTPDWHRHSTCSRRRCTVQACREPRRARCTHRPTLRSVADVARRSSGIAREAFISGMHLAAIIAGCVALLAAAIVYRKLPAGNPHAQGAASLTRQPARDLVTEH